MSRGRGPCLPGALQALTHVGDVGPRGHESRGSDAAATISSPDFDRVKMDSWVRPVNEEGAHRAGPGADQRLAGRSGDGPPMPHAVPSAVTRARTARGRVALNGVGAPAALQGRSASTSWMTSGTAPVTVVTPAGAAVLPDLTPTKRNRLTATVHEFDQAPVRPGGRIPEKVEESFAKATAATYPKCRECSARLVCGGHCHFTVTDARGGFRPPT